MAQPIRILGVDPGLNRCGWGVAELHGARLSHVSHGVIKTDPKQALCGRLKLVFEGLRDVAQAHNPTIAAVEETFVNANPRAALALGQARGAALAALAIAGLSVDEISATEVKKALTGTGRAEKDQVSAMVRRLLPAAGAVAADAADALAVAICAAHRSTAPASRLAEIMTR